MPTIPASRAHGQACPPHVDHAGPALSDDIIHADRATRSLGAGRPGSFVLACWCSPWRAGDKPEDHRAGCTPLGRHRPARLSPAAQPRQAGSCPRPVVPRQAP